MRSSSVVDASAQGTVGRGLRRPPTGRQVLAGTLSVVALFAAGGFVAATVESRPVRLVAALAVLGLTLTWQSVERRAPNRRPWGRGADVVLWAAAISATLPMATMVFSGPSFGGWVAAGIAAAALAAFLGIGWRQ